MVRVTIQTRQRQLRRWTQLLHTLHRAQHLSLSLYAKESVAFFLSSSARGASTFPITPQPLRFYVSPRRTLSAENIFQGKNNWVRTRILILPSSFLPLQAAASGKLWAPNTHKTTTHNHSCYWLLYKLHAPLLAMPMFSLWYLFYSIINTSFLHNWHSL